MRRWMGVVTLALCACASDGAELGETVSEINSAQGSQYQGSQYQGSQYQGSQYQGSQYQGSQYQGAAYGGTTLGDAARIVNSAIVVWTPGRLDTWEERFPDKICYWNNARTVSSGCTTFALSSSPLLGLSFETKFKKPVEGTKTFTTISGRVTITAVAQESSLAMHPLEGNSTASACTLVAKGVDGCEHPQGCRRNCDLWQYTLTLRDDTKSTDLPFCSASTTAYALPGTYDVTGQRTASSTSFTFACANGTIAKCTSWGYRPYGYAKKACTSNSCSTQFTSASYSLSNLHQSCVRAATADYCASGKSFTRNGTLVDIYDHKPAPGVYGFVPNTRNSYIAPNATAFVWESTFDRYGGLFIGQMRYQELVDTPFYGNIEDDAQGGCKSRWFTCSPNDDACGSSEWTRTGDYPSDPSSQIFIDSAPPCAHSELTVGTWLHEKCSKCTAEVKKHLARCTNPSSSYGWDQACVDVAKSVCTGSITKMTYHSECTTGLGLPKYATGCTLAVCSDPAYASCCAGGFAINWTSACVSAANLRCGTPGFVRNPINGFCSNVTSPPTDTAQH